MTIGKWQLIRKHAVGWHFTELPWQQNVAQRLGFWGWRCLTIRDGRKSTGLGMIPWTFLPLLRAGAEKSFCWPSDTQEHISGNNDCSFCDMPQEAMLRQTHTRYGWEGLCGPDGGQAEHRWTKILGKNGFRLSVMGKGEEGRTHWEFPLPF